MLASQWVWQLTKSVSIPAEEQNAGRVVDFFYRMEFHITPRFFSDSNYLFFLFSFRCLNMRQVFEVVQERERTVSLLMAIPIRSAPTLPPFFLYSGS